MSALELLNLFTAISVVWSKKMANGETLKAAWKRLYRETMPGPSATIELYPNRRFVIHYHATGNTEIRQIPSHGGTAPLLISRVLKAFGLEKE